MKASPGEVRLPALFSDHMVLQQDWKLPVWGWSTPDEKITVKLGNHAAHAVADDNGKWRVEIGPLDAGWER